MKKEQFSIRGMHCISCALTVERALKKVPGVKNVSVNFALEKVTVEYESGTDPKQFREAVEQTGYKLILPEEVVLVEGAHSEHLMKEKGMDEGEHDHHRLLKEAEMKLLRRKLVVGLILSVFVVLLSFPDYFPFVSKELLPTSWRLAILFGITLPVEFWVGWQFWRGAWFGLKNFSANMDTLVALGTGAAFVFSAAVTFLEIAGLPGRQAGGAGLDVYFDVAAVVTTLVILGKYLEAKAKSSASEAIKKLLKLQAKTAHRLKILNSKSETRALKFAEFKCSAEHKKFCALVPNKFQIQNSKFQTADYEDVPIEEIKVDDILLVKPGEKIPVDGIILEGTTAIDESMISGESMSVDKEAGDEVVGSTINKTGAFTFKATKVGKETFLAQIIKLVEEAQASKAPIQRLADKITAYFVPIVLVIAVISFVVWFIWGPSPSFNFALINAVAVLVVACPCALGLATPMAIMVGTGKGAEKGIIIRDAEALETAGKIDAVVLDKTGTLTRGEPVVTDVIAFEGGKESEVLQYAASLEKFSEHPIAKAVVAFAASLGKSSSHPLDKAVREKAQLEAVKLFPVSKFKATPGKGLEGEIGLEDRSQRFFFGNRALMATRGLNLGPYEIRLQELESEGKTTMVLASDKLLGVIAVADTLKEKAKEAVQSLAEIGLEVWMITGDNERTAKAIGRELGIDKIMSRVLPQEKAAKIDELQKSGKKMAMVGDGINDAPALTQADVGVAIGTGTDIAIESGDITLVSGDPLGVYEAIRLSRRTLANIKQNLFWACIYNIVLIPVAAGVLWPFFGILLSPILAGAAMVFSSVSVVLNSLRLKRLK